MDDAEKETKKNIILFYFIFFSIKFKEDLSNLDREFIIISLPLLFLSNFVDILTPEAIEERKKKQPAIA